ncbi:hypothetical protein F441_20447, partial [Phytophthora nicotianae CJ01A1]
AAGLHFEHRRVRSAFGLALARHVGALERLHLAVEDLTGLDDVGLRVLHGALAGGPRPIRQRSGGGNRKEESGRRHERREGLDHLGLVWGCLATCCPRGELINEQKQLNRFSHSDHQGAMTVCKATRLGGNSDAVY